MHKQTIKSKKNIEAAASKTNKDKKKKQVNKTLAQKINFD